MSLKFFLIPLLLVVSGATAEDGYGDISIRHSLRVHVGDVHQQQRKQRTTLKRKFIALLKKVADGGLVFVDKH